MSRFADPTATKRMTLGPCECPNTPHEEDWIDLRSELGAGDIAPISGGNIDALLHLIREWNLLDPDGSKALIDRDHIERLFPDTFETLDAWIDKNVRIRATVPNARAVRSRSSSRASGSPIPIRKKAG